MEQSWLRLRLRNVDGGAVLLVEVSGCAEATDRDIRRLILIQLFQLLISAFPLLNSAVTRSTVKSRFSVIFKDFFKKVQRLGFTAQKSGSRYSTRVDQKLRLIHL